MTKTPLLLLPGLLLDERLFAAQIEALADLAERQVGNLRGSETMAGLAEQALADAPDRFALCGLSMGGYLALEMVRRAPQRVEKLALLDTQARADPPDVLERRLAQIAQAERGDFGQVLARLLPLFVHPERHGDRILMSEIEAMARDAGPEVFTRQQRAIMSRSDHRSALGAIACPTLVLCGRQDALTPVDRHEEIAAAMPDATLVVLPRCGHLSPLERPGEVSAELRLWLEA
jgi:pimeloyl-ACP methyl ester carboxylesterase